MILISFVNKIKFLSDEVLDDGAMEVKVCG